MLSTTQTASRRPACPFGGALFTAGLAAAALTAHADPIAVTPRVIEPYVAGPYVLAVGDVDGNGAADLVTGGASGLGSIPVYRNNAGMPPTFLPESLAPYISDASQIEIADMNGDGFNDVVLNGEFVLTESLYLLLADGQGGFGFAAELGSPSPTDLFRFVVSDLDSDTDLDVIGVSRSSGTVVWFENNGAANPVFTNRVISSSLMSLTDVAVCDIDSDGFPDVVTATSAGVIEWFQSDGAVDPAFTQRSVGSIGGTVFIRLECGDADGDNDTDVFFGRSDGVTGSAGWIENDNGTPPVFVGATFSTLNLPIRDIAVGDFDADGDLDLAGTEWGVQVGTTQRLTWWDNDGASDPTFVERTLFNWGGVNRVDPNQLAIADFDRDGDLDFATTGVNRGQLAWFENLTDPLPVITAQPDGQLVTAPTTAMLSVAANAATFYQWQKDGVDIDDDAVFSGTDTPTLTINATLATEGVYRCVVGNIAGVVASDGAVLGVQAAPSGCLGDLNGDGATDVFDFADFAGDFGCGTE